MSSTYKKSTGKSRRIAARAAVDVLLAASQDDLRKPGYVFKKSHNALRDANRTKGLPYANCAPIHFVMGDPATGRLGKVVVCNKARTVRTLNMNGVLIARKKDKANIHVLDAIKGARFIPLALREQMGLVAAVKEEA